MSDKSSKPSKLWNRNFFLLWQGQFVSQLGNQAYAIAMMFWIKHATGSATLMGMMMMLSMLPAVILGPVAGTFADHYSRRKIIIYCDVMSGIFILVLAYFMYFTPGMTQVILAWLFIVSLLLGVVRSFFLPAITASIPDIVPEEKVAAANSLNQSSYQISTFAGQGMGGFFFMLLGAPLLILIDGITFLFSAASESFITIPQKLPDRNREWKDKLAQFKKDIGEGFKFAWGNKGMRIVFFIVASLNFFIMPIPLLLPFYVEDFLKVTPDWYGYILSAFGFGSLIGFVIAGVFPVSGRKRSFSVSMSMVVGTALLGCLSIVETEFMALLIMLVFGIMNGFIHINIITVLQTSTPSDMRGRIFGFFTTLTAGLSPIAMGLSGVVADLLGQNVPLIYGVCGTILVVLTVTASMLRPFRRFLAEGLISNNAQGKSEEL